MPCERRKEVGVQRPEALRAAKAASMRRCATTSARRARSGVPSARRTGRVDSATSWATARRREGDNGATRAGHLLRAVGPRQPQQAHDHAPRCRIDDRQPIQGIQVSINGLNTRAVRGRQVMATGSPVPQRDTANATKPCHDRPRRSRNAATPRRAAPPPGQATKPSGTGVDRGARIGKAAVNGVTSRRRAGCWRESSWRWRRRCLGPGPHEPASPHHVGLRLSNQR